jgi:hypothetical protein
MAPAHGGIVKRSTERKEEINIEKEDEKGKRKQEI